MSDQAEVLPGWAAETGGIGRPRNSWYKWETIGVAESFYVPKEHQTCTYKSFREMTNTKGRELNRKFRTRVIPEGEPGAGAFQCWRSR